MRHRFRGVLELETSERAVLSTGFDANKAHLRGLRENPTVENGFLGNRKTSPFQYAKPTDQMFPRRRGSGITRCVSRASEMKTRLHRLRQGWPWRRLGFSGRDGTAKGLCVGHVELCNTKSPRRTHLLRPRAIDSTSGRNRKARPDGQQVIGGLALLWIYRSQEDKSDRICQPLDRHRRSRVAEGWAVMVELGSVVFVSHA